jgi:hypothetical protein
MRRQAGGNFIAATFISAASAKRAAAWPGLGHTAVQVVICRVVEPAQPRTVSIRLTGGSRPPARALTPAPGVAMIARYCCCGFVVPEPLLPEPLPEVSEPEPLVPLVPLCDFEWCGFFEPLCDPELPVEPEVSEPEPELPIEPEPLLPEPLLPVLPEPLLPEPVVPEPEPVVSEPVEPEPLLPVLPEPLLPEPVPIEPEPLLPEPLLPVPVPVAPEPLLPAPVPPEVSEPAPLPVEPAPVDVPVLLPDDPLPCPEPLDPLVRGVPADPLPAPDISPDPVPDPPLVLPPADWAMACPDPWVV